MPKLKATPHISREKQADKLLLQTIDKQRIHICSVYGLYKGCKYPTIPMWMQLVETNSKPKGIAC